MIKTPLSVIRVAAFCLPLALVTSCGSGSEAVQDSTININPDVWTQQTGPLNPACSKVLHYRIEVRSETGYPQVGVQMLIDSPNGFLVYEGSLTPTAAACGETIVGAIPKVPPYYATTGAMGGYDVTVVVDWIGGQDVTATAVNVFSGTSYGKTDVDFTCSDANDADAFDCPG